MANGYTLGVGFYPLNASTGEPLSGPHYTRQEAVNAVSRAVVPCCILEVVGDWQPWLQAPGFRVPFDNVKTVVLEDGRKLDVVRLASGVHISDLATDAWGVPVVAPEQMASPTDPVDPTALTGFVDEVDINRWAADSGSDTPEPAVSPDPVVALEPPVVAEPPVAVDLAAPVAADVAAESVG